MYLTAQYADQSLFLNVWQIVETMNMKLGGKKQCLRRTLTGPW